MSSIGTTLFSWPFDNPFFHSGIASSAEVPARYDLGINGRGYMLDLATNAFTQSSIQISRQQLDVSAEPSEASLSRDAPWRRAWETWHHGAGQNYRDRQGSDPFRFRASRGMDIWLRDALHLLPNTDHVLTTANPGLQLTVLGSYAYLIDGATVRFTADGTTWSVATGLSVAAKLGIVNDGQYIYVSDGSDIYRALPGAAFSAWHTLDASLLAWCNGRLMAAGTAGTQNSIYNIIDTTGPPPVFTYPSSAWTWTAFSTGPSSIYAAGYVGDTSLIYSIPMKSDGSGLDVPEVVFEFPDGERCYSLAFYLGYLVAGTTAGLRLFAITVTFTASHVLTAGPPLRVPTVKCLEGQDRYMWFGWTNYGGVYTGLGRASLVPGIDESAFTDTNTPAYASDLMADANVQGEVTSVVTYRGRRMFAVAGSGVWLESATDLVPDAEMYTGWITYGLPDNKVVEAIDVRTLPLHGTITVGIATASSSFLDLVAPIDFDLAPTIDLPDSTATLLAGRDRTSDRFEIRLTFTRDATHTQGPVLSRLTMHASPVPARGSTWQFPLLLCEKVELVPQNTYRRYEAKEERDYLALVCESGSTCTVQVGLDTWSGTITDWEWHATHRYLTNDDWNGTLLLTVKQPSRGEIS